MIGEIIKKMRTLGFDKIILTPHYIEDSKYSANNKIKNEEGSGLISRYYINVDESLSSNKGLVK